jgi:hypothetical protein
MSFITFGCWNKGFCNSSNVQHVKSNDFSRVVNTLNQYIDAVPLKPVFMCVLGDNYYPEILVDTTGKKKKIYSYRELESGFKCLKKLLRTEVPVDILIGNHDTEGTSKMEIEEPEFKSEERHPAATSCKITESQLKLVQALNTPSNPIQLVLYNFRTIGNTIIIMVDSNPYIEEKLNCECYMPILDSMTTGAERTASEVDVPYLKQLQLQWLSSVYEHFIAQKRHFDNVVIMAHHPICCFKMKNEKNRFDTCPSDEYLIFCQSIYLTLRDITGASHFYYNSADLHTYQSGTITLTSETSLESIRVHQYIVGTGGTTLEPEVSTLKTQSIQLGSIQLSYTLMDVIHDNGFLVWTVGTVGSRSDIKVQFVKAVDTSFKYAYIHKDKVAEVFNRLSITKETPAHRATKTVYRVGTKNRNYSGGRKNKIKMNTPRKNKNKSKKNQKITKKINI